MSKQRKTPEQASPEREAEKPGVGVGPESATPEHAGLGNAAIQARLAGGAVEEVTPFDVVRDTALPMVGRAALALEVEPKGALVDRLVEIVVQSDLPVDRKDAICERLRGDETLATGISEALTRWFGADGADVRAAVSADLGRIEQALMDGHMESGGWRTPEVLVAVSAAAFEGTAAARAEVLITDLARATSSSAGPDAMLGFCRDLHLALMWLEDEEEDLEPDVAPEQV